MAEPRIAMLGGTFDPVHIGHLRSAVELGEALSLDRVHLVVNRQPPHRATPGVSADDRLAMVAAGAAGTPRLVVDDREIKRDGPSYSLATLESLRAEYGDAARLVMAIGMDAFRHLAEWHRPEALFAQAHVVVIERPGAAFAPSAALTELVEPRRCDSIAALMAKPHGGFLHLPLPNPINVSATELRERINARRSIRYLVPEAVERLIIRRGLYRDGGAGR